MYFVAPVTGLITLWLVYRLAKEWFDGETALLATAIVAWNPLVIGYAKQPMSDMPATMWTMLALLLSVRASTGSAFGAGLAAGAAVVTRPALLVAAAAIPFAAHRGPSPRERFAFASLGLALVLLLLMAIQNHLFGSPFLTGYGGGAALFSWSHVATNLEIFMRHGWSVARPAVDSGTHHRPVRVAA